MRWIAVLVAGLLIVAFSIGSVAAQYDDQTKIIFITLNINKGIVSEKSVEVRYGHPPNLGLQKGNFTATLRARDGTALFAFDIWDPRSQFEDHEVMEDNETCNLMGSMWHTDNVDIPLIIPYDKDIRTLELTDRTSRTLLISVNVTPAMNLFHARFFMDPAELRDPLADTQNIFLFAGSVLAVVLMVILIRLVRKS